MFHHRKLFLSLSICLAVLFGGASIAPVYADPPAHAKAHGHHKDKKKDKKEKHEKHKSKHYKHKHKDKDKKNRHQETVRQVAPIVAVPAMM